MGSAFVDEGQLAAWGEQFARALRRPAVIALSGELGTGKTTLARALARGLGATDRVTSPTFALVHRYAGAPFPIWHVDAYRLRPGDDARDLALEDMLRDRDAVVIVEWPEHLGTSAPAATHRIHLAYADTISLRQLEWS